MELPENNYRRSTGPSGWTAGKVVGVILGVIGTLVFGSFTLIVPFFLHNPPADFEFWWRTSGFMTLLCVLLVIAIIVRARAARAR
jgi:hypothetical protein